jgi:hypothetical protein
VVLTYGRTAANTWGQVLEVLAWAGLLGLTIWRFVRWLRRRRFAEAVLDSSPILGGEVPLSGGLDTGAADDAGSGYRDISGDAEPSNDASIDKDERPEV